MYIDTIPNRNSPPAILVRESYRERGRHKKRTLANLSRLPPDAIEALRRHFKNEAPHSGHLHQAFDIVRTEPYGHVAAVLGSLNNCGLESVLATKRSRMRDLAVALIATRILNPKSKLATARGLSSSPLRALSETLGLGAVDENDLYEALDWLGKRHSDIERRLAKRHLQEGSLVLYDVSSTWFEGERCPLAAYGHSRDGKRGKKQITFGVLCARDGCPVSVEVFAGNVGDPSTVAAKIHQLRQLFALRQVVLVGDRGMLTSARIREDLKPAGLQWISALRFTSIRALVEDGALQPSLFDERDLAEITCEELFPGERLMVCRNPILAQRRTIRRQELLAATEAKLEQIVQATGREKRRLKGVIPITRRVTQVLGSHKMAKHFTVDICADSLTWQRNQARIDQEAALDGFYVVRTNVAEADMDRAEVVQAYKGLSAVERAFRTMKTIDLKVRPIYHYSAHRVRAHVLLCMLAYYVEFHMRKALAPILFDDPYGAARSSPVQPAVRSPAALDKAATKTTADGALTVHSFRTLLEELSTVARQRVKPKAAGTPEFDMITVPNPLQEKAFELLNVRALAKPTGRGQ